MTRIEGGCHCGNIRFRFEPKQPLANLPVRRCGCTFCVKHGAFYTSDPAGQLFVNIRDSRLVSAYHFGTGAADPQICRQCGVMPVILARIESHLYAVINLAAAEHIAIPPNQIQNVEYEHETAEEGRARRSLTWIAQVNLTSDG